jgi:hypothetical protein
LKNRITGNDAFENRIAGMGSFENRIAEVSFENRIAEVSFENRLAEVSFEGDRRTRCFVVVVIVIVCGFDRLKTTRETRPDKQTAQENRRRKKKKEKKTDHSVAPKSCTERQVFGFHSVHLFDWFVLVF